MTKFFDDLLGILRNSNYSFNALCTTETLTIQSLRMIQSCMSQTLMLFQKKENKEA